MSFCWCGKHGWLYPWSLWRWSLRHFAKFAWAWEWLSWWWLEPSCLFWRKWVVPKWIRSGFMAKRGVWLWRLWLYIGRIMFSHAVILYVKLRMLWIVNTWCQGWPQLITAVSITFIVEEARTGFKNQFVRFFSGVCCKRAGRNSPSIGCVIGVWVLPAILYI